MSLKSQIAKRQLKAMGIDFSNPKNLTCKTIKDLIKTSVPTIMKPKEMIDFLNEQIADLKNEFGD